MTRPADEARARRAARLGYRLEKYRGEGLWAIFDAATGRVSRRRLTADEVEAWLRREEERR